MVRSNMHVVLYAVDIDPSQGRFKHKINNPQYHFPGTELRRLPGGGVARQVTLHQQGGSQPPRRSPYERVTAPCDEG